MDVRRTNLMLRSAGLASIGLAVVVIAIAAIAPQPKVPKTAAIAIAPTTRHAAANAMPTTRAFASIGDVALRRSLADAPKLPQIAVDPTMPPSSFGLSLRGTILEPGRSVAVFATPAGETKLCAIGERIDGGGEVVAITASDVTLRVDGRLIVLRAPPTPTRLVTQTTAAGT